MIRHRHAPRPMFRISGMPRATHPTARRWAPTDRRLVVVDIENIAGSSAASPAQVAEAMRVIDRVVGHHEPDVWVYATGVRLLRSAMRVLPATGLLVGDGVDGADRRLVETLDPEAVVGRYAEVVLASGDGRAFIEPIVALRRRGVPTDVVSRVDSTSHALRAAARRWVPLASSMFAVGAAASTAA